MSRAKTPTKQEQDLERNKYKAKLRNRLRENKIPSKGDSRAKSGRGCCAFGASTERGSDPNPRRSKASKKRGPKKRKNQANSQSTRAFERHGTRHGKRGPRFWDFSPLPLLCLPADNPGASSVASVSCLWLRLSLHARSRRSVKALRCLV